MTASDGSDQPAGDERAAVPGSPPGLTDVARAFTDAMASARAQELAAEQVRAARHAARRDEALASDADRERACDLLEEAYGLGRLDSPELDLRTTRALTARTHGDLDEVLAGLGGFPDPARAAAPGGHPVRKGVFGASALVSAPLLLFGGAFLLAGSDLGDRVFGMFLLAPVLAGLHGLYRWAWPRA